MKLSRVPWPWRLSFPALLSLKVAVVEAVAVGPRAEEPAAQPPPGRAIQGHPHLQLQTPLALQGLAQQIPPEPLALPATPPSAMPPQRRSPASITNRGKGSTPKAKPGRAAPMRPAPLLPRALRPRLRRPRLPEGSEGLRPPTSRIATPRSIKRTATRTGWWGRSAKTANEHRVDPHVGAFFDGADFR